MSTTHDYTESPGRNAVFVAVIADLWLRADPLRIVGLAARPEGLVDGERIAVEEIDRILRRQPGAIDPTAIMRELRDTSPKTFEVVSSVVAALDAAETPDPEAVYPYPSKEIVDLQKPVAPADLKPALYRFRLGMRAQPTIEREIERQKAIAALEDKGYGRADAVAVIRSSLEGLDDKAKSEGSPGKAQMFISVEPAKDAVDGARLLDETVEALKKYIVLPPGGYEALALWCLFAHTLDAYSISPRLTLSSPTKRCGKTRTLSLIKCLTPKAILASNVTGPVLFRSIEKFQPTMLFDEADCSLEDNEGMRSVLNSGHTRDAAWVLRCEGDDHEPKMFSTWCALAVALIGKLTGRWATLEDRSVVVELKRKTAAERVSPSKGWTRVLHPIHGRLARWGADHLEALRVRDPEGVPGLDDRAQDNWRPLLAVADEAGDHWPSTARRVAKALSASRDEAEGAEGVLLLHDIKVVFKERDKVEYEADRILTDDLVKALIGMEDRPWATRRRGQPIDGVGLSRMLRPFGVRPRTIRMIHDRRGKGYLRESFEDVWERYPPVSEDEANNPAEDSDTPATPPATRDSVTTLQNKAFLNKSTRDIENACHGSKSEKTPIPVGLSRCHGSGPPSGVDARSFEASAPLREPGEDEPDEGEEVAL